MNGFLTAVAYLSNPCNPVKDGIVTENWAKNYRGNSKFLCRVLVPK